MTDLRCYGRDLSTADKLKQRITIRSNYLEQLNLLVNEDVQLSLNSTVIIQDCIGSDNFDTTLQFPAAASGCHTCGLSGEL